MNWNIVLILGIVIFASISSIISTGNLIDRRKNGLRAVTKRGWVMILLNLGIVLFSLFQYISSEKELEKKEKDSNTRQTKRDSTTISTITEILGKYGFKLDSTNQTLEKILNDTSTDNIISDDSPAPVLKLNNSSGISLVKHINGEYDFDLAVCSEDASSTGFDLLFYFIQEDSLKTLNFLGKKRLLYKDEMIAKGSSWHSSFIMDDRDGLPFERIYVVLKGTYQNMSKTKTFDINNVYYYQKKSNSFAGVTYDTKEKIDKFMMKVK